MTSGPNDRPTPRFDGARPGRGCEARLNRSTYEQLAEIALARGQDWTVMSGGETYSLLPPAPE